MQRRRVLAGLAAGGVSLLAGCSGGNGGSGNNTTQANGGENGDDGGEPSPTPADSTTAAATTMATTAQQTATQMATTTPTATVVSEPTPTTGPTSVPMTTGSSPSTAAPTGTATTGPGTATGLMDADFSNLTTYTGDSFSIKYPAGWSVSSETSGGVMFRPSTGLSQLLVKSIIVPPSATTEQVVSKFLKGYQQGASGSDGNVEIQKKRTLTLPNGNSAKLVETQIGSGSVTVHQEILLTVVNGTAYIAVITVPGSVYTTSAAQKIEKILLSLTIKK